MKEKILSLITKACDKSDEDFIDIALDLVPKKDTREKVEKLAKKIYAIHEEEGVIDEDLQELINLALDEPIPTRTLNAKPVELNNGNWQIPEEYSVDSDPEGYNEGEDDDYYAPEAIEEFVDPLKTRGRSTVVQKGRPNLFDPSDPMIASIGREKDENGQIVIDEDTGKPKLDKEHRKYKAGHAPVKKPKVKNIPIECGGCGRKFMIPPHLHPGDDFGTKCKNCIG